MPNEEQLKSLLAILYDQRRLQAQQRIPAQDLLRYGEDAREMIRSGLARGLADHMMKVGEMEKVFSAPRRDEPYPIDDATYEQWDVEMVVMTRSEFRALNELCHTLLHQLSVSRHLPTDTPQG